MALTPSFSFTSTCRWHVRLCSPTFQPRRWNDRLLENSPISRLVFLFFLRQSRNCSRENGHRAVVVNPFDSRLILTSDQTGDVIVIVTGIVIHAVDFLGKTRWSFSRREILDVERSTNDRPPEKDNKRQGSERFGESESFRFLQVFKVTRPRCSYWSKVNSSICFVCRNFCCIILVTLWNFRNI